MALRLHDIYLKFISNLNDLEMRGKLCVCSGALQIFEIGTCSPADGDCGDRFKVLIPFAGQSLTWEVLFNCYSPEEPPDFIFDSDEEFLPDITTIKSLVRWEPHDPNSLTAVVRELLREYKQHHIKLIEADARLQFEYSSLLDLPDVAHDDVEIYAEKLPGGTLGAVTFLVRLNVDFSSLPSCLIQDSGSENEALLHVVLERPDYIRATPQLFLAPHLEQALAGYSGLRIPAFPSGTCLMDYVPAVATLLRNVVEQVIKGYELRKRVFTSCLTLFGRAALEYDAEGYRHMTFLLEIRDFYSMLHIKVPQLFPSEGLMLTLQSIYHTSLNNTPFCMTLPKCSLSTRTSASEWASHARIMVLDHLENFKQRCMREGTLDP